MTLPSWLEALRRAQIINRVHHDERTIGDALLGVHRDRIFDEVIGGGQADFDEEWIDPGGRCRLTGSDRALLYAFFNQKGHLEELSAAMAMLARESVRLKDPVVIDLGCGPCTGGLALADAIGPGAKFTYIGLDNSRSMLKLGERLATAPEAEQYMAGVQRFWTVSLREYVYPDVPRWRPVLLIASYLLASPTVNPVPLLDEVMEFVDRVGRGPVVLLYTNSTRAKPNRHFPAFQEALTRHGFNLVADNEHGEVTTSRGKRTLRYALFSRQARNILPLGNK